MRSLVSLLFTAVTLLGQAPPDAAPAYRIQPGDQLDVKFYYNRDLNETVTVRPDGAISLQLVGDVPAAGLSPAALTTQLRAAYARQLREPEVTVIVRTSAAQRVYVAGEIGRPGVVEIPGRLTLLQALAAAGGAKRSARLDEVLLIRHDPVEGRQILTLNVRPAKAAAAFQDPLLRGYDVVIVPRTRVANVNDWVDQYIRSNLPVTFGIFASPF